MTEIKTVKEFGDALLFQYPIPVSWAVQQYSSLITTIESQKEEIKKLNTCPDCGGSGINEMCHDPYYALPCVCTVDWMSEAMKLSGQVQSQKEEIEGYKAITELAVKRMQDLSTHVGDITANDFYFEAYAELKKKAFDYASEIERLQNEQT